MPCKNLFYFLFLCESRDTPNRLVHHNIDFLNIGLNGNCLPILLHVVKYNSL